MPPPPPPPPPGFGAPPPPPPPNLSASRPAAAKPPVVGALLQDITKGKSLKKAVTNDRSAPIVGGGVVSGKPTLSSGAPAVPGMPKAPASSAPPVPGGNRARSNSDQGSVDHGSSGMESAPQLGGLFVGGMPKLKKRGGGVDTGANRDSSYTPGPEPSSRSSALKPPSMPAPRPPTAAAPKIPPGRPDVHSSATTSAFIPSVASLRKPAPNAPPRPSSSSSMKPPIPGKKPPLPTSRKPSTLASQSSFTSQAPTGSAPPPPIAPPPPTASSAPIHPISPRTTAPPPPPSSANGNASIQSVAMQAAIRAASQASPVSVPPLPESGPPPPPPPSFRNSSPALPIPASPAPPPPSHRNRSPSQPSPAPPAPPVSRKEVPVPIRSMLDPTLYTLSSNGTELSKNPSPNSRSPAPPSRLVINDPRWKFQDESILPKPRDFMGGSKKYRAGRGSSVPLDLSSLQ
ncbi:hypothetical protein BJ878DRAFT_581416 [Calycina marina]|uniref:WH2 domain-containing protein n=1 Tax=Calycina marina TaxID=1763456 RepID=A0A9P8CIB4_9HELO|nr:hypothetical protein BJ878DRAFT_581416 [Calycina marina]